MSARASILKNLHPLASDLDHILDHTENLWEELRGKRLFITGGTGFFGCWFLESFIRANDMLNLHASALVLSRHDEAFRKKMPHIASNAAIQFQRGDVSTFSFPEGEFSHIIHAATPSDALLCSADPLLIFNTIVEGTRHTLDFAVHGGVKKFLFTSSGAVYGKQPLHIDHIPENYDGAPRLTDPGSAYGEGKRAAEMLCLLYSQKHDIDVKIARCFTFVGPYLPLDMHYAAGNFIRDGLNGGPIHVKGDGTPYRSYLYAADLMIWLWTILFKGQSRRPYNVGSEKEITIAELAHFVASCFDNPPDVQVYGSHDPARPPERYVPSTERCRDECGVRQTVDLEESIRKTIGFILKNNVSYK